MVSVREGEGSRRGRYSQGVAIARLADLAAYDRKAKRAGHRDTVYKVLSEGFMIALSVVLIPVLVIPLIYPIQGDVGASFEFLYWTILMFFILEYGLKLYYADDRRGFVLSLRHIFDLFVIIASITASLVAVIPEAGGVPILLRLIRLPVVAVLGGRSITRRGAAAVRLDDRREERPMEARILSLNAPQEGWKDRPELVGTGPTWWRFDHVSGKDIRTLERRAALKEAFPGGRLREWAYPRGEEMEGRTMVFLQVPTEGVGATIARPLLVWHGVMMVEDGKDIITVARDATPFIDMAVAETLQGGGVITPPAIMATLIERSLDQVEDYVQAAEVVLSDMEIEAVGKQPRSFLAATYSAKKEIDHTLVWLVHVRALLKKLTDRSLSMAGWGEGDEATSQILLDRCEYLIETTEDLSEGLGDDIGFYLNNTSYQTNKVMKVIAVLTALTVIPTVVGGMLGMNLVGSPWAVTLAEVVTAVAVIMLFTSWIYYQVGWLKG